MPPSTDKPGVTGGVTEACLFNDHSMCNNPRCGCTCHRPAIEIASSSPNGNSQPSQPKAEKSCPTCGIKRPFREIYCRVDGARLSSLACNICGVGREPEDKFCHQCGAPADAKPTSEPAIPVELPRVVNLPTVPEFDKSILSRIQEELDVSQPTNGVENANQQVIEQPAGTQGSFKLVSKPNPNRIRVPAGGNPVSNRNEAPVPRPSKIRLPIKPS